jgi:hypothetical protein
VRGAKSLIVLAAIGAALGAYIYFVEMKREPAGTAEKKAKIFTVDTSKLEDLEVKAASGETSSLKKVGDKWTMASAPGVDVDQSEVGSILSTIESLEIQRTLEENPTSVAQYGLEPARLSVAFRAADENGQHKLLLGKKTPTGGDLYARVEGQPKVFLVSAYLEESLSKTPFNFRDKAALKIDRVGVDAVTLEQQGSPALVLGRRNALWRLSKPLDAAADFTAVDTVVGRIAQAKMKSIEPAPADGKEPSAADLKKYGLDKPAASATLGVGSTRAVLALGSKKDDTSVYARDMSRPLIFTIDATILDDLKKKPADLRKKELFEFRSFTAVGLDASLGKNAASFAKVKEAPPADKDKDKDKEKDKDKAKEKDKPAEPPPAVEKWKQTKPSAKDVDQGKITELLTTLSNLRADTFADKPVTGGEELVITASFGDTAKPTTEKITFRKSGTTVHAIVAGEPGAAVISTADFDKALALFKEIAGIK